MINFKFLYEKEEWCYFQGISALPGFDGIWAFPKKDCLTHEIR